MLVLSEFAGAAQSLNGSIVVNPWDSQEVADAIFEAVSMPADTRAINHDKLFKVRFVLGVRVLTCSAIGVFFVIMPSTPLLPHRLSTVHAYPCSQLIQPFFRRIAFRHGAITLHHSDLFW